MVLPPIARNADDTVIKATMEMNASISYDFENSKNELTRGLKVLISGLSREEAKTRLINEGKVREVTITFIPFWLSRVSSNIDNIEFVIHQ